MFEHSRRRHRVAGIGIVAILACGSSQAEPLSKSVSLPAPPGTRMLVAPEVSEDGRTLAFTIFAEEWQGSVHVASLAELSTGPLRGGKFVWSSGGFSPDGRFLLVSQLDPPKMLMRIPYEGGEGIPIAASGNVGADWGPDNNIVIGSEKSGLRLVPVGGAIGSKI